ncbi:MAG: hypothetical protein VKK07_11570 [Merismopediaceae bacterium]|nr:hypothetical protein [Merismopediaceae bacterium]
MLSDTEIESAKKRTKYSLKEAPHHEHNDCIRIAYEWLDAQVKTKGPIKKAYALKHIIEKWGGRYVSRSDVDVAAELHPDIYGTYPYFNISSRLTNPSQKRLDGIAQAFTQNYSEQSSSVTYKRDE